MSTGTPSGKSILLERAEATKRINPGDYDPMMVDSIILQAEESMDEDILDLLDRKLPGSEFPLSHDPAVREKKLKSIDRIQSGLASAATTKAAAEEKADKQRHNGIVADVYRQLSVDPNYVVPEETLTQISRRDPDFRGKLKSIREGFVSGVEDPDAIALLMADIHEGASDQFVLEKFRQGVIKDPTTLTKALDRVKAVENASKPGGILDSASYKDTIKRITNATGMEEESGLSFLDGVRGITEDGIRANHDYRTMLLEWEAANPKATLIEREKASYDIGKKILSRITPTPYERQKGTYKPLQ
nr:hypothetical protein [Mesorhizobium sp.]